MYYFIKKLSKDQIQKIKQRLERYKTFEISLIKNYWNIENSRETISEDDIYLKDGEEFRTCDDCAILVLELTKKDKLPKSSALKDSELLLSASARLEKNNDQCVGPPRQIIMTHVHL